MRRTSQGRASIVAVLCAVALAACTGAPVPGETVTPPTVVTDKTAPPDPLVPAAWPLTGIEGEVVTRPAVSVKIENTPQARPQSGLEDADIVWENIVEYGVPRFVAMFHSTLPQEVGPIRSVRPADARIVSPVGGLLAYSGGAPAVLRLLRDMPVQAMSEDEGDPGFYRLRSRPRPHNVYGSLEEFLEGADSEHADPPDAQFAYAPGPGASTAERHGSPTERIRLALSPISDPGWTWDTEAARWLRWERSTPAVDAAGDRLAARNVVVIEVVSFDSGFNAQTGAPVPDLRLEGEGDGLVATGGRSVPVTWSKESRDEPLVLTGPDGEDVRLAPGNTWVELVPLPAGSYTTG